MIGIFKLLRMKDYEQRLLKISKKLPKILILKETQSSNSLALSVAGIIGNRGDGVGILIITWKGARLFMINLFQKS